MFHAHHHLHKRKRKSLKKYPHSNKWIRFLDHSILAIAVIGGMISSTLLTLIVIPSAYSLSIGFIEKKRAKT